MTQFGLAPIDRFEMTKVGVPMIVAGLFYKVLIGTYLGSEHAALQVLTDRYNLRPYLVELRFLPGS